MPVQSAGRLKGAREYGDARGLVLRRGAVGVEAQDLSAVRRHRRSAPPGRAGVERGIQPGIRPDAEERRRTARDRNPIEEHRALAEPAADLPVADEAEPPGAIGAGNGVHGEDKVRALELRVEGNESKPPSEALVISTSSSMSAGSESSVPSRRMRTRPARSATNTRPSGAIASDVGATNWSERRSNRSSTLSVVVRNLVAGAAPGVGNGAPDVDPVTVTRSVADFALSMSVPLSSTKDTSSIEWAPDDIVGNRLLHVNAPLAPPQETPASSTRLPST